jgi:hypothetical protein
MSLYHKERKGIQRFCGLQINLSFLKQNVLKIIVGERCGKVNYKKKIATLPHMKITHAQVAADHTVCVGLRYLSQNQYVNN